MTTKTNTPIVKDNKILEEIISISQKYKQVKNSLESFWIERDKIIDMALLAILSKNNLYIHGESGTGKTDLIISVCSHFPFLPLFMEQGGHDIGKDDIFGPINIKKFTDGESYERMIEGFLLKYKIGFLDEFGDIPEKVQRAFLGVASKKRFFRSGSKEIYWEGRTCFFASNFVVNNKQTRAVLDRVLLKASADYVNDIEKLLTQNKKYDNNGITFTEREIEVFDYIMTKIKMNKTHTLLAKRIFEANNINLQKPARIDAKSNSIFAGLPRMSDRALKEFQDIIIAYAILNNLIYEKVVNEKINDKTGEVEKELEFFIKAEALFSALQYLAPIEKNISNTELLKEIKNTHDTYYVKFCKIKIPHDAGNGHIIEAEQDINVAYQNAMQSYNNIIEQINLRDDNASIKKEGWDIDSKNSVITMLRTIFEKLQEAIKNTEILKNFPVISMEEAANITSIAGLLDIISGHIISRDRKYETITYKEIKQMINNSKAYTKKKTQ